MNRLIVALLRFRLAWRTYAANMAHARYLDCMLDVDCARIDLDEYERRHA